MKIYLSNQWTRYGNMMKMLFAYIQGGDLFTGWMAIRESWTTIFSNTETIRFTITNTKIKILIIKLQ
ncbi:MAG: nuclear transport factor 2 family protein [Candidatus Nitrosocosmicus sp.]|nr:nuclear transport factor 2 family protein [Candidatus Nitrosocosmicus sp.]